MNHVELWHWWMTDQGTGQRMMSPGLMTEHDARRLDRTAQRVYGTLQVHSAGAAQAAAHWAGEGRAALRAAAGGHSAAHEAGA